MVLRDKNSKNKPYKNRTFFDSFRYAYQGVCTVFQEERNMRFYVLTSIVVLLVSLFLSLSFSEWFWIFLVCFLLIFMVIWITVIVNIIIMFSPYYHPLSKI